MNQKVTKYKKPKQQDIILESSWDILSNNTQAGYQSDIKLFNDFVNKDLSDVNQKDIIDYVAYLREKKYKNATINRKISSISKLFKVYRIAGLLKFDPIELARQSGRLTFKVMRSHNSGLTIKNIQDCINTGNTSTSDMHVGLMIKFLAKTGLRISEMINIELDDIAELNENTVKIRVLGKGRKERFITIEKDFVNELRKVFNHDTYLFISSKGLKYNRRYVWRLVKERFKRSTGLDVWPHMLRHFYATYKIVTEGKNVKAVSKFLGHSSTAITLDMYTDSALNENEARIEI